MFEKVNPSHADKIADRIAGAIVDLAYRKEENPRIAVEVLIGHGVCTIIIETGTDMMVAEIEQIVERIAGAGIRTHIIAAPQDELLAKNQEGVIRCGDNGIFRGAPVTAEQRKLTQIAKEIYAEYPSDGKYLLDGDRLTICQSNADSDRLRKEYPGATVNPLGDWIGGTDTDAGATNRKLGSDMGDGVTGGGLCVSGDTEYLGSDLRWHRIDEYDGGKVGQWKDGVLEFVQPTKYIKNESDDLILFKNDSKLSMCLTPKHQILLITSKGNYIKKTPAL